MVTKILWIILMFALLSIGTHCEAAKDYFGNEYKELISLEELKPILNGEELYISGVLSESVVAQWLAAIKDKDQVFSGEITVGDLLELSRDYPDLRFCNQQHFEQKFVRICAHVSDSEHLEAYCKQGIKRLHSECLESVIDLFNKYVITWSGYSNLLEMSRRVSKYVAKYGKPWDTPMKTINNYMNSPQVSSGRRERLIKLCTQFNKRLDNYVIYFDKGANKTIEELKSRGRDDEVALRDYCAAVGEWKWQADSEPVKDDLLDDNDGER